MATPTINDDVSADFVSPGSGGSNVGNLSVGAGTVLIVAVVGSDAYNPVDEASGGMKVGGITMTQVFEADQGSIYYLDNLAGLGTGSKACTVYFNAGGFRAAATFWAVDHPGSLTLIDSTHGNGFSDNTPTDYVLPNMSGATTDDISFGYAHNNGFFAGNIVLGSDLVEDHDHNVASIRVKTFHDTVTPIGGHAYGNNATGGTMYMGMAMFGPAASPDLTLEVDVPFGTEAGFQAGISFGPSEDILFIPSRAGTEVGFYAGVSFGSTGPRQVMLVGGGIETPEMTVDGEEGQVLTYHEGQPPTWEDPTGGGGGGSLTVKEADGTPTATSVDTIVLPNGSLTDDGGGQVTIAFAASIDWAEDGDISTQAFGDSPAAHAGTEAAPAGHVHGMPANPVTSGAVMAVLDFGESGDISASALGDTALAGATGEVADAGHRHPREANIMTTQDDLIVGGASGVYSRLGKGSDGQVLTVDPSTHHLVWATPSGLTNPMSAVSDIIYSSDGSGTPARLAKGAYGARLHQGDAAPIWLAETMGEMRPLSPSAYDEEMDSTTLSAWTSWKSSGTVTNQSISDFMESPSAPSWNANTDIPGALVMQALAGTRMGFYRAFPFTPGDVFTVVAKLRLHNAFTANDLTALILANETTPATGSTSPTNGVGIRIRMASATSFVTGAFSNGVTAAVAAAEVAIGSSAFVAFTGRGNGDILTWVSSDGVSWWNVGRFNGALCIPNMIYFMANDNSSDASAVSIVDFIRFALGHNNPWLLLNGRSAAKMRRSLRPTGNGAAAGGSITYSTGSSMYPLVDDVCVDSADYVTLPNGSQYALVTFPTTGLSSGTITNVRFGWEGTNAAPSSSCSLVCRIGGTNYTLGGGGNMVQNTTTPIVVDTTTCPDGSGAWSWTKANAIEFGVLTNSSGPFNNKTYKLWVEITYTP